MAETAHLSPTEAYDKDIFPEFEQIGTFQAFDYLGGDKDARSAQKEKFINSEVANPTLDYPKLTPEFLSDTENYLLDFKRRVLAGELNDVAKQAYRWRINEKLAEIRLLKASASGDMRRFARYNRFIYGEPERDVFAFTLEQILSRAEQSSESDNEALTRSAKELLEVLPASTPPEREFGLPDQATIGYVLEQTAKDLEPVLKAGPDKDQYSSEEVVAVFEEALKNLGDEDWKVLIDPNATNISAVRRTETINVAPDKTYNSAKMHGLKVEEIGTHVARAVNGKRSKLMLLSVGLDRYDAGEEGVGSARGQAFEEEIEGFSGLPGHLAISLAVGLDGQPRNFRQVFEVLEKYFTFDNISAGQDEIEARKKAQNMAWGRCVRTFRGSDCSTPGVCFMKDIVYREGNIAVWDMIRENPDEVLRFSIGKYDPTNPRHIWVLEQLGISDEDLAALES